MASKHAPEPEEHENTERWLLTYSDLITLLLIFFIIMYTMAKVDVAKFEVVKESLAGALKSGNTQINVGNPGINDKYSDPNDFTGMGEGEGQEQAKIDEVAQKLIELIQKYNLQDYITVIEEERGLDIEVRNELQNVVLFNSGSSELTPPAQELLTTIGLILNEIPDNHIRVEGHTDNLPIRTQVFPSNWELSTARATNVVKLLVDRAGLKATRLAAVGYAEYRAVADNSTDVGRSKNRRVNIVIIRNKYSPSETNQSLKKELID